MPPLNLRLTMVGCVIIVSPVTHRPETNRFLRAAVKSGLRMQQAEASQSREGQPGAGLRTLQRIKESLRKQKLKSK